MKERKRNTAAVWLCLIMLVICLAALARYLLPLHTAGPQHALDGSMMGMVLIDIPDSEAATFYHVENLGVYVLAVDEQSPAYAAGVRSGDCIISVNGARLDSAGAFSAFQQSAGVQPMQLVFGRGDGRRFSVALPNDVRE